MTKPNPGNKYPDYENQLETKFDFDSSRSKEIYEKNKDIIADIVLSEITKYINDDDLCNDWLDMFPKRSFLTGEWYIARVFFEYDMLSAETALLAIEPPLEFKTDYLGLEVHLNYDSGTGQFTVYGIDSSSI